MALADIDTIVITMLENRSFDHMLGYLSLPNKKGALNVEGLRSSPAWLTSVANLSGGKSYQPSLVTSDPHVDDPPHTFSTIAHQISTPPAGPVRKEMGGFVDTYAALNPRDPSAVMQYHDQRTVPVFDFFARNFCVCDHWFCSVPLGTQANRLMAMAGESRVLDNSSSGLPHQVLVYDWLTKNHVHWCSYQWGNLLPFFFMMPNWSMEIFLSLTLSDVSGIRGRFRRYSRFKSEWQSTRSMPSVIFVEPEYTDGPHFQPNDDHPPTGVTRGQALLLDLYNTLTSNEARWAKTLLIVTYDEHGGFFDHVPPLPIPTMIAGQPIPTTGVRVPAFLISPWVEPGHVFNGPLDHTSILELLAERFTSGHGYSIPVNERQAYLQRISSVLTHTPAGPIPVPPAGVEATLAALSALEAAAAVEPAPGTATPNGAALDRAARDFARDHPDLVRAEPWGPLREYLAEVPPL